MKSSSVNGWLAKWLFDAIPVVVASTQSADSGGVMRLGSFWPRHLNGTPCWFTWVRVASEALAIPLTPSHEPYRLSKLWFSSKMTTMCLMRDKRSAARSSFADPCRTGIVAKAARVSADNKTRRSMQDTPEQETVESGCGSGSGAPRSAAPIESNARRSIAVVTLVLSHRVSLTDALSSG